MVENFESKQDSKQKPPLAKHKKLDSNQDGLMSMPMKIFSYINLVAAGMF